MDDLQRICIRTARIACGLVLVVAGLLILAATPSVSDTPFAALTLGDIAGAACGWFFAILMWVWAWSAAFGPAPTKEAREALRASLPRS